MGRKLKILIFHVIFIFVVMAKNGERKEDGIILKYSWKSMKVLHFMLFHRSAAASQLH